MITLQTGSILKVNPRLNSVSIQSFSDGSVIEDVTMDSSKNDQELPRLGDTCLFFRDGSYITKIIKIWSSQADTSFLNPGEKKISSDAGATVHVTDEGTALLGNSHGTGTIEATSGGILLEDDEILIKTLKNQEVLLDLDGNIQINKWNPDDATDLVASVRIASDGTIQIDGAKVFLGPGATEELKRSIFGDIVTSGIYGTYKFDFVTGLPIPGSSTIKGSS